MTLAINRVAKIKNALDEAGFPSFVVVKGDTVQFSIGLSKSVPYEKVTNRAIPIINTFGVVSKMHVATLEFCTIEIK